MPNNLRRAGVAAVLLVLVFWAAPADGWQPPASGAQGEFVPLKDLPQQEQLPAAPLVLAAYGFVWVVLLVYVWSLWRRIGKVSRDVDELARRIGDSGRHA